MTDESKDPACPPYLRERTEIEEEIRNRQTKWRVKHLAAEIKSAKRGREGKRDKERLPSAGRVLVEPETDDRPPARSYRSRGDGRSK